MKIAIIGAGVGGMAAAWDLVNAGHEVTIYEAGNHVGGLASGFKESHWDWTMEHYYHHWFTTDRAIQDLMDELGLRKNMWFRKVKTVAYHNEKFYPLDSPMAAMKFPGFNLFDMIRFGLVTAYLRYFSDWQKFEKVTAVDWIRKVYGKNLFRVFFEPLLIGKFGPYYDHVNMAWLWARFKVRSTALGGYQGGFQAFNDQFADILQKRGVKIQLSTPVSQILQDEDGLLTITDMNGKERFQRCLVTVSPGLLARMVPGLPNEYLHSLLNLKHLGAVVMIFSLQNPLSPEGYYWYNLPKDAGFPFLALVEHTNFVSKEHYGGDNLVYCGDYLAPEHEYFQLSKEELAERFMPSLKKINPNFSPDWIRQTWMYRSAYAQPVPEINHSRNIPSIKTPLNGLYFASMSQVYPWDRGTNFAVMIARQAARQIIAESIS